MMQLRALAAVLSLALTVGGCEASDPPTLRWSELEKMPLPPPGLHIPYGTGPEQWGELRLPAGGAEGSVPVMIMIHGGCWQSEFTSTYFTRLAAWFTAQGFATWTIEYRRIGNEGGGWPGTFLDVAAATDKLRELARDHPIDLNRVYAAGHSAGGQLALWLASRGKSTTRDGLFVENPLRIRGVLGLAAITDLYTYRVGRPNSCNSSVDRLLGGSPETVPARYAATSPVQRLPLGVPQVFIQGARDPIVEPASVAKYIEAAKRAGDEVTLLSLPQAGHFETSVQLPASEPALREAIRLLSR